MKKVFFLLLIFACSGCLFNQTETLICESTNNIGEVDITNKYSFTYKKEEINKVLISAIFNCKKEQGPKVYEYYMNNYKQLARENNDLIIEFNDEDCVIDITVDLSENKKETLNSLNLSFLEDVTIDKLRENLADTEYICK